MPHIAATALRTTRRISCERVRLSGNTVQNLACSALRRSRKGMLFLGSLSLLLVVFNSAHAETGASLPDNVVRSTVQELGAKAAAHPDVPGLSVAVLRQGSDSPVSAAFGVACIENSTAMTTSSLFKIGSVTKVFTAALIHRLI